MFRILCQYISEYLAVFCSTKYFNALHFGLCQDKKKYRTIRLSPQDKNSFFQPPLIISILLSGKDLETIWEANLQLTWEKIIYPLEPP